MTIRPSSLPRKGAQIVAPGRLALYGILTLFAAIFILPFVWQLGGSLKTPAELATGSFSLFPAVPQWENYAEVFRRAPIATWFANSVVIAVLGTLGLAGVATVFAGMAFGQATCTQAATTNIIRAEGTTEQVAPITITCTSSCCMNVVFPLPAIPKTCGGNKWRATKRKRKKLIGNGTQ